MGAFRRRVAGVAFDGVVSGLANSFIFANSHNVISSESPDSNLVSEVSP